VTRWDSRQSIQLYANGLRERLITYFEGRGAGHGKPKRVAVTGCSHGAGVTTIATSLAAALSRIPDVKVLLVDMNMAQGVARTFRNGEPSVVGDATESNLDPNAAIRPSDEQLAVVPMRSTNNGHHGNGESTGSSGDGFPSGLAHLAPQFEANDHEFIIFDLPPATSTSMTPRMAGYMDIVLLVLESEKTGREVAGRAATLMRDSRANVAAVLNKYRKYVPERLCPEF
jgi:Mrp family chromosome partitioning ATPase